jgi:hypothetical protein
MTTHPPFGGKEETLTFDFAVLKQMTRASKKEMRQAI